MKRTAMLAAGAMLMAGFSTWKYATAADPPAAAASVVVRGTVHAITLPEGEPELPPAPGRETAQAFCVTCHTTQYIVIQPRFPRETWLAEVTKMRKAFSAPIPEEKVNEIVEYLVAVRGVEKK